MAEAPTAATRKPLIRPLPRSPGHPLSHSDRPSHRPRRHLSDSPRHLHSHRPSQRPKLREMGQRRLRSSPPDRPNPLPGVAARPRRNLPTRLRPKPPKPDSRYSSLPSAPRRPAASPVGRSERLGAINGWLEVLSPALSPCPLLALPMTSYKIAAVRTWRRPCGNNLASRSTRSAARFESATHHNRARWRWGGDDASEAPNPVL